MLICRMIDWEETRSGLRVSDRRAGTLEISAPDWERRQVPARLPRPVDVAVSGQASRLGIEGPLSGVVRLDGATAAHADGVDLPTGRYLADVDAPIATAIRFDGPATIHADDALELSFADRRPVTLGFRGSLRRPRATLELPPTPTGFATALSHLHAAHGTSGPDRSLPWVRAHPPRLEYADECHVPERVREDTFETGIELRVPDDLTSVLVVAPLAYYLQASVEVTDRDAATLVAPAVDVERHLGKLPSLEERVASVLQRAFYLDCLVRRTEPVHADYVPDLDRGRLAEASPAERLRAYLSIPEDDLSLPDWHLASYVPPTPDAARALPYLLDRLSLIYRPRTRPLDRKELLKRSLTDFYRLPAHTRPIRSADVVSAELGDARSHAWLDDSTPIDVFDASTTAFEHGLSRSGIGEDGRLSFVVVRNDREMDDEHAEVARIYEERAAGLPIDVTAYKGLSCAELATLFGEPHAFVHYIGHCDVDGLRCTDGSLSAESLSESAVRTFFLNACGTYHEGRTLVDRGSVAGGVTFSKVLNEQATTVGTTFARLLLLGFSIDRAMQLARRRIMMGKNYAVVGDGTYVLAERAEWNPATLEVEPADDGYALSYDVQPLRSVGGVYRSAFPNADRPRLVGTPTTTVVAREVLYDYLKELSIPIVYDGQFFWPRELRSHLDCDKSGGS